MNERKIFGDCPREAAGNTWLPVARESQPKDQLEEERVFLVGRRRKTGQHLHDNLRNTRTRCLLRNTRPSHFISRMRTTRINRQVD